MTEHKNFSEQHVSLLSDMPQRSIPRLMVGLFSLVGPVLPALGLATLLGIIGFLSAFGLSIAGAYGILSLLPFNLEDFNHIMFGGHALKIYAIAIIICAAVRGIFHYLEQYFNHFLAFRVLAQIRIKCFDALRALAPAKLDGSDKGQLIAVLMGDIELLEVFYAHTMSPILIAFGCCVLLNIFFFIINPWVALVSLVGHIIIAVIIPVITTTASSKDALESRNKLGYLNNKFLDKLAGIREIIAYQYGNQTLHDIRNLTDEHLETENRLRKISSAAFAHTDSAVTILSALMVGFCALLLSAGQLNGSEAFIVCVVYSSTFAPFIALASLAPTLARTMACARRVLQVLDLSNQERAMQEDLVRIHKLADVKPAFNDISFKNVSFGYRPQQDIIHNLTVTIPKGRSTGIMGFSGSGKSTFSKLLMGFYPPNKGDIFIGNINLAQIKQERIFENLCYMTQHAELFDGTIKENMLIAKRDATDEEIYDALKKASLYELVSSLPKKLHTTLHEMGSNLSGGEKQRLGLARCFLAQRALLVLDEPTSNLDALSEAEVLKTLTQSLGDTTLLMISHRASTLGACDDIHLMEKGKLVLKSY